MKLFIALLACLLSAGCFRSLTFTSQTLRLRVQTDAGLPATQPAEVAFCFPATEGLTEHVRGTLDRAGSFGWGYSALADRDGIASLEIRTTNLGKNNLGTDQVTGSPLAFRVKVGSYGEYLWLQNLHVGQPVRGVRLTVTPISVGQPTYDKVIAHRERERGN